MEVGRLLHDPSWAIFYNVLHQTVGSGWPTGQISQLLLDRAIFYRLMLRNDRHSSLQSIYQIVVVIVIYLKLALANGIPNIFTQFSIF